MKNFAASFIVKMCLFASCFIYSGSAFALCSAEGALIKCPPNGTFMNMKRNCEDHFNITKSLVRVKPAPGFEKFDCARTEVLTSGKPIDLCSGYKNVRHDETREETCKYSCTKFDAQGGESNVACSEVLRGS